MSLDYGFAKGKIKKIMAVQGNRHHNEVQYHMHLQLDLPDGIWDAAVNVGTSDADDLVKYKLIYDYHHPLTAQLAAAPSGFTDLTDKDALPALDFMRSDILKETGAWRESEVMDGTEVPQPIPALKRLFHRAQQAGLDVYVFGRRYNGQGMGIHDTHMNQGSQTQTFHYTDGDDGNDHNAVWQDGAVMVPIGEGAWAAYFAAFEQQLTPTDGLGNPAEGAKPFTQ
jgi:uncharacterized protein YukJ